MLKKLEISVFLPQKVLTQPKNVVTIAGFASKKAELSTQTKHCEWFAVWMTGPRLILVFLEIKLKAIGFKVLITGGAQDASWEILK